MSNEAQGDEPEHRGEIRQKAVRGAAWTIALGIVSRLLQVVGTVALTHFISREVAGEVSNAALLVMHAHILTTVGIPHALVSRKTDARGAFHATVLLTVTGVAALGAALALQGPLGGLLKAQGFGRYLWPLALATLLQRIANVPERLLQYRLRFREASIGRGLAEVSFTVVAVVAAFLGAGGMAIVAGNVARGAVALVALSYFLRPSEWARPHALDRRVFRDLAAFGLPLGAALALGFAARNLDNFVVSALFGTAVVGAYNLAYNLADIPASQIGEQIGDVLAPAFARLDGEARRAALPRVMGVLAIVVFPLGVGLGATAPTLVATFLPATWSQVGELLVVLAVLSVARPIGWTIATYLQTTGRTRAIMWLSALRLVAVIGSVAGLGALFGPIGACFGVGVGFLAHALANVALVVRQDRFGVWELLGSTVRVLGACVPLVAAVLGARAAVSAAGISIPAAALAIEVVAGALGFSAGVAVLARREVAELLRLARDLRSRRAQSSAG